MSFIDLLNNPLVKMVIDVGASALGSGDEPEAGKGFVTQHTARTKFDMPEIPRGYKGYITGTGYQTAASRQMITNLERLMEIRNKSMQTGFDALANKYIRESINSTNTVSGKKLFGTALTSGAGQPNIGLGSTKIS